MSFTKDDPIKGAASFNKDAALAYAEDKEAVGNWQDYIDALWDWSPGLDIDFAVIFGQWCDETDVGKSDRWLRGDPAGIGIYGDDTESELKPDLTGEESAAVHLTELSTKIERVVPPASKVGGIDVAAIDPHLERVVGLVANPGWPPVIIINDLRKPLEFSPGDYVWAANQAYGDQIATHMNAAEAIAPDNEGGTPVSEVVFGLVPKPTVLVNHLDYGNPMIGYSSKIIVIEAVIWHRMIGTLFGTDGWFEAGNAATAYGIGVQSIDGTANDGLIIEWIDPSNGHYYGESSGPVSDPYGDGLLYWQRFGTDRVNPQSVAIEISGYETTPLTEKSRQAIAALSAYFADRREIPWNEFPIVPDQDRSFIIWHQEITYGTGKTCPADVVMNETNALIERTAGIMRQYQETEAAVDEFPAAEPFDSFQHGLETQTDQHDGPDLYQYLERRFTVAPERTGTMRVSPDAELEVIKTLPEKAQIRSAFVTRQDDLDWILDTDGYSWKANSFNPKITLPMKNQPT